jgi:hypothetical protein
MSSSEDQMIKLLRCAFLVYTALAMYPSDARAESIGPDCGTCQGSIYTLDILGLAPTDLYKDGSFDTYRVALTIDTSGYTGTGSYIDEVAVKISSSVNKANIVEAPEGASTWNLLPGGLNADGCTGSGSGFECAEWIGSGSSYIIPGPVLKWVFDIDISSPLFSFTSTNYDLLPSIKARYVDDSGNKVGALVSEKVPEPATLALLTVGMTFGTIRRRRIQR